MLPRIVLLTTGGTIASVATPDGVVADKGPAAASFEQMLPRGVRAGVEVEHRCVLNTGSYALSVDEAERIARAAVSAAEEPAVVGVVVTHGTDTMEETAYLCDLLYGGAAPVVFCGAQRPASDSDPDGPRNVRNAIRFVLAPDARETGVCIAFGSTVIPARTATKVHTRDLNAFAPRSGPPVAEVGADQIVFLGPPRRSTELAGTMRIEHRVTLVTLSLGASDLCMRAAAEAGSAGIVLQCFGMGNAPPWIRDATADIISAGIPVLVTSRCAQGPVAPVYGRGGGHDLQQAGAWFANELGAAKARVLMMVALGAAENLDQAQALVATQCDLDEAGRW